MCSSKVILIWDVQNFCNFVVSSFELTSVLKIPEQNIYYTSFSELWRNPEIFSCFILDWCVFSNPITWWDLLCRLNITKALGLQVPSKREHGLHSGPAGVWKVGTKQLQLNWNWRCWVRIALSQEFCCATTSRRKSDAKVRERENSLKDQIERVSVVHGMKRPLKVIQDGLSSHLSWKMEIKQKSGSFYKR